MGDQSTDSSSSTILPGGYKVGETVYSLRKIYPHPGSQPPVPPGMSGKVTGAGNGSGMLAVQFDKYIETSAGLVEWFCPTDVWAGPYSPWQPIQIRRGNRSERRRRLA